MNLFAEIKRKTEKKEIEDVGYIQFSLLRHSLLDYKLKFCLEAYSSKWYFDETECEVIYEANWLNSYLNKLRIGVEKIRKLHALTLLKQIQKFLCNELFRVLANMSFELYSTYSEKTISMKMNYRLKKQVN